MEIASFGMHILTLFIIYLELEQFLALFNFFINNKKIFKYFFLFYYN